MPIFVLPKCLTWISFAVFLLLSMFLPMFLFAQAKETRSIAVSGVVKDRISGEALPFATIQVKGTKISIATNADGYFTLQNVPSDTSTLIIQYTGYAVTEIKLVKGSPHNNLSLELSSAPKTLDEVVIKSKTQDVVLSDRSSVGVVRMTPKKLALLPNIGEKDILRSFQLMPGVSASNESSSGLYVRGGTPDQNLVLYDGFTVYHVDHLYGFFSAFNSNALKDVQLYKGGFESRFGGRLSSVTEITGKDGNKNKFAAGADLSLLSINAYAELPIGDKFTSVFAFRKSYKGFLYNKIFQLFNPAAASDASTAKPAEAGKGGTNTANTTASSYFYDLNGKFTWRPTKKDIISLSIFNGTDNLDNSSAVKDVALTASTSTLSTSSVDLTDYGNFGSSLRWSRKWSNKLYGNTILSYSRYYSNRNNSASKSITDSAGVTQTSSQGTFERNKLTDLSVKSDYQFDISNGLQLQFGGFATKYDISYSFAQNDTISIISKINNAALAGGYFQGRIKLFSDRLTFVPGVRASYFGGTGKMYYEPRATFVYNLNDRFTLKAATGKYYQFANRVTREDILSGSRDFWLLSDNSSIPVSSAYHYVLGGSYEVQDYLFSVEGYYKTLNNISEYSLRFNPTPSGVGYQENFFTGTGTAKGVEFLAQKKSGRLNGWLSYTLGQARNRFAIYSDATYPADQDVTHEFKAVATYKIDERWDISGTFVYATGRPYTAPSGAYSVTLLDGTIQNFYTVTSKNSQRLPAYHRADVAVNFKFLSKLDKKETGGISFSLFNVYGRTNVWYKQYTIASGQILTTNVNYLGLTPNLTLSFKLK